MNIKIYNPFSKPTAQTKKRIASFLFEHLGRSRDPLCQIEDALDYALGAEDSPGGLVVLMEDESGVQAAAVVNKTGMKAYLTDHILMYVATHELSRGKGLGKQLLRETLQRIRGSVSLHVLPDNPAVNLYRQMGFQNPYVEMRLNG